MSVISLGVRILFLAFSGVLAYYIARIARIVYLVGKFRGPPAIPILGNSYMFKSDTREFFLQMQGFAEDVRQKTGGTMRTWFGPVPNIGVISAKDCENILSSSRNISKNWFYEFLRVWLGDGLLLSTGKKWFHRRKLLTPTFHFSILQQFMDVFNEQTFILTKKLKKFADKSETVNIFPHVTYCVLDIICETAMGKRINAQGGGETEYAKTVVGMSEVVTQRIKRPWFWPDFIYFNTEEGRKHQRYLAILQDFTKKVIKERMVDPPSIPQNGKGQKDEVAGKRKRIAFLDLLLQMHRQDPSFTLEDIREEVDTFMFEGHDTTAAALSWCILLLALQPDVQARLQEELDQVFGTSDRPVMTEDLAKLQYLTCVVKESLRLFPSVPEIGRALQEDIVIDGKKVPKEAIITVNIYAIHRDPEQFPDPNRFDPDRFLPENSAKRHPFAFIPFSAGPRNCIGQKFAMMEEKVILANLFRKFSVESVQTIDETKPAGQVILRPADGEILIKLSNRK